MNLHRIDAGDVVHDHANLPTVPGETRLPLRVGEAAGERCQCLRALFEALGEQVRTLILHELILSSSV